MNASDLSLHNSSTPSDLVTDGDKLIFRRCFQKGGKFYDIEIQRFDPQGGVIPTQGGFLEHTMRQVQAAACAIFKQPNIEQMELTFSRPNICQIQLGGERSAVPPNDLVYVQMQRIYQLFFEQEVAIGGRQELNKLLVSPRQVPRQTGHQPHPFRLMPESSPMPQPPQSNPVSPKHSSVKDDDPVGTSFSFKEDDLSEVSLSPRSISDGGNRDLTGKTLVSYRKPSASPMTIEEEEGTPRPIQAPISSPDVTITEGSDSEFEDDDVDSTNASPSPVPSPRPNDVTITGGSDSESEDNDVDSTPASPSPVPSPRPDVNSDDEDIELASSPVPSERGSAPAVLNHVPGFPSVDFEKLKRANESGDDEAIAAYERIQGLIQNPKRKDNEDRDIFLWLHQRYLDQQKRISSDPDSADTAARMILNQITREGNDHRAIREEILSYQPPESSVRSSWFSWSLF